MYDFIRQDTDFYPEDMTVIFPEDDTEYFAKIEIKSKRLTDEKVESIKEISDADRLIIIPPENNKDVVKRLIKIELLFKDRKGDHSD